MTWQSHGTGRCAVIGCKLKQNANANSCASLVGLVLSFIACFILLVIAPLYSIRRVTAFSLRYVDVSSHQAENENPQGSNRTLNIKCDQREKTDTGCWASVAGNKFGWAGFCARLMTSAVKLVSNSRRRQAACQRRLLRRSSPCHWRSLGRLADRFTSRVV